MARRTAPRDDKLIKVPSEVHREAKVKAAQRGQSISKFVGEAVNRA